jgi:hypothetical protein
MQTNAPELRPTRTPQSREQGHSYMIDAVNQISKTPIRQHKFLDIAACNSGDDTPLPTVEDAFASSLKTANKYEKEKKKLNPDKMFIPPDS